MFAQSLLLALAAATAVTANHHAPLHPGHLAAKRELSARQTQTDDDTSAATSCLDGLMSIYSTLPTAPPEIVSWEEANTITDPCSISIPASISSAFSAYETAAVSWYSAHSSDLFAALSQCPELSSIAGGADTPSVCTGAAGGAATGSPAQTTGGGDDATASTGAAAAQTTTDAAGNASTTTTKAAGTTTDAAGKVSTITTKAAGTTTKAAGTGSAASSAGAASTKSTNAGPRETAFVGAAVAAAGFLGVIAAL